MTGNLFDGTDRVNPELGVAGFLDVETTGLDASTDEVVELAFYLFEFRRDSGEITRIVDRYVGLREPAVPISEGAARVHGIRMEDLRGKSLDMERLEKMVERAEFIVAHNASFDRGFIRRLVQSSNRKPWLCSMSGIDWKGRGFVSRSLQSLLRDHGINVDRGHRADDDVRSALELLAKKDEQGYSYFYELLQKVSGRIKHT